MYGMCYVGVLVCRSALQRLRALETERDELLEVRGSVPLAAGAPRSSPGLRARACLSGCTGMCICMCVCICVCMLGRGLLWFVSGCCMLLWGWRDLCQPDEPAAHAHPQLIDLNASISRGAPVRDDDARVSAPPGCATWLLPGVWICLLKGYSEVPPAPMAYTVPGAL